MSYVLEIGGTEADLFPEYEISISVEVYSSEDVGELRYPFSFPTKLPYTQTNRGIFGGYDYTSAFGDLSNKAFEYILYTNGNVVSKGTVFPKSVVVNTAEPYFDCEFNDLSLQFIQGLKQLNMASIYNSTIDGTYGDVISETTQSVYDWLTTESDYAGRDIELPYVDFDNSQKKYGYNARQFTAWGLTDRKVGLMPALNVPNFMRRCFGALGYDYVSKFGGTVGTPTWSSTGLYMLYPSRLLSETADSKQTNLAPYTSNIYKNQSQIVGDNDWDVEGYVVSGSYNPYIPTNYDPTLSIDEEDYGTEFKTPANIGVADVDYRSGFVAYSVGFDGRITFGGGSTSSIIDDMRVCVYSTSYFDGTYTKPYVVEQISDYNNAYFIPTIVLWEAGVPKYRLPLKDVSGDILELQPIQVEQPTNSIDYQDDHTGGGTHSPYNVLYFESFTGYLNEVRQIVASNKYQISFEMEMTGYLTCDLENHAHNSTLSGISVYYDDIKKMRVFDYTYSTLDIRIATDDVFLAALPDDVFEYKLSLETANTYSPYELFIEIVNRFGLSLVYNYSDDKFYLDTMDDMRTGVNVTIDAQVDDIQLYTVYSAGLPYNKIKLLNKDFGGLYDKFPNELAVGSYDGIFDIYGSGDYSVQLNSALINPIDKTVCGDLVESNWDLLQKEGITEQQAGFISNEIRDFDAIGLRFGYLSSPTYNTNIRYPKFLGLTYSTAFPSSNQVVDSLSYDLLANVKMQGIMGDTGSSGTLRFADRDGNTQAFYAYYTGLERIAANTRTSMDLNAVVPVSWMTDNYQYSKIFEFSSTGEEFVIESIEGTIYGDVVYATLKIKFL